MSEMGRPRKEIDLVELEKLCQIQATAEEIAGWFECSVDTISRRIVEAYGVTFAEYYKQASSGGKISLRRKQFQKAQEGNVAMLIWLGKQVLGQREHVEHSGGAQAIQIDLSPAMTREAAMRELEKRKAKKEN